MNVGNRTGKFVQTLSILVIEDNDSILGQLADFFTGLKWAVDCAHNGELGLSLALNNIYDVVLLDLNLPDIDGLTVCREIKQKANINTPVLMLTARDSFQDKAKGFGLGADDYVTKPFELRELALRCQALARRHQLHVSNELVVGELVLCQREKQAKRQGHALQLTTIGFTILNILAQAFPEPVSRSEIMHKIWADNPPDSDALKSHIYSLRNALDKPFAKPMLVTITNIGFKLEVGE